MLCQTAVRFPPFRSGRKRSFAWANGTEKPFHPTGPWLVFGGWSGATRGLQNFCGRVLVTPTGSALFVRDFAQGLLGRRWRLGIGLKFAIIFVRVAAVMRGERYH